MKKWLYLGGAIIAEVGATIALKAALEVPVLYLLVVSGYISAFGLLAVCLRAGMTISVAYGAWGAGGIVATALLAAAIFGEPLTWTMGLGIVIILAGIVTVESGTQKAQKARTGEDLA